MSEITLAGVEVSFLKILLFLSFHRFQRVRPGNKVQSMLRKGLVNG